MVREKEIQKPGSIGILVNSLEGGGAERVASDIANDLTKAGASVYLIALATGRAYPLDAGVRYRVLVPSWITRRFLPLRLFAFAIAVIRLVFLIRRDNIPTILSILQEANYANLLARLVAHHKAITSVHSIIDQHYHAGLKAKLGLTLVRRLMPGSTRVVAVSDGAAEGLRRVSSVTDIQVIPNPFDIKAIRSAAVEPLKPGLARIFDEPVIITVGNLRPVKGQWHLIRSFARVKQRVKNCRLIILGNGPLRGYLQKMAEDYGIDKDVFMLGWQANPFPLVQKSTVFAMSSISESMTMSLIEAMICGTPVVSTDCIAGPREILAPGSSPQIASTESEFAQFGVLTPPVDGRMSDSTDPLDGSEIVLAQALEQMLLEPALQEKYRKLGSERARDFDISLIGSRYRELLLDDRP